MKYTLAGIHTGIGKTVVSAVLAETLRADYWKPVQAGLDEETDSEFVRRLCSETVHVLPEKYKLKTPASPHLAARIDKLSLAVDDFVLPPSERLIVETAGGVMSPLNDTVSNIGLMKHLGLPVILVIGDYLGSINHSMLTVEVLKSSGLTIKAIVFSGSPVESSREWIIANTGLPVLPSVPFMNLKDHREFRQHCEALGETYRRELL